MTESLPVVALKAAANASSGLDRSSASSYDILALADHMLIWLRGNDA